jgi:hypothetical protein
MNYRELKEMLKGNQHKLDKNKNGKLDADDFKKLRKEESELQEYIEEAAHKVMVTVSDPNHPAVSQRKEQIMKRVVVNADNKDHAVVKAKEFYKKKGYKVHDAEYHSPQPKSTMKTEEVEIDEKKTPEPTGDLKDACWKGYTAVGMKDKNGKKVPNCVPESHAPVAPTIPRKYIKGTPEWKAHKEKSKPINGHPTNVKEGATGYKPGWMLKSDPKLAAAVKAKQDLAKKRQASYGDPSKGISVKEETDLAEAAPFKTKEDAVKYAKEKVKTHRDNLDGIEIHAHSGGFDVNHTSNSSGRNSLKKIGAKHVGTIYKEEVELDEGLQQTLRKYVPGYAKHQLNKKMDAQNYAPGDSTKKTVDKDVNYARYKKVADKLKNEEVEEIEELSKSTLASYAKKATHDARMQQSIGKDFEADRSRKPGMKAAAKELADKYKSKSRSRERGVGKAIDRLAKEEFEAIEERNKQNAMMRKSMDASRGARYKAAGNVVPDREPEHSTAQAHNKAIGRALRKEDMEFTQEELQLIEQFLTIAEKMNLSKATMGDVIKDFKKSDAPQFAGKSDEKKRQMAIAAKLQADRESKNEEKTSFSAFLEGWDDMLKAAKDRQMKTGDTKKTQHGTVTKTATGVTHTRSYSDNENDDADDKPKRGRGRPAGSKNR